MEAVISLVRKRGNETVREGGKEGGKEGRREGV